MGTLVTLDEKLEQLYKVTNRDNKVEKRIEEFKKNIPDHIDADARKRLINIMETSSKQLMKDLKQSLRTSYTIEEISEIIAFHNSPLGQKCAAVQTGQLMLVENWMKEALPKMMDIMFEEMGKDDLLK